MNPKSSKKQLFLRLAKDADLVAAKEKRYALEALGERKYSLRDERTANRLHQSARAADDIQETGICKDFYLYRLGIFRHYRDVAKKFRKLASKS